MAKVWDMRCQREDIAAVQAGVGPYTHLDDVDIPHMWNICRDGVDNFAPDMIERDGERDEAEDAKWRRLSNERRAFEINRRVVNMIHAAIYSYSEDGLFVAPPDSFSDADYDLWIGENESILKMYKTMGYTFIPDEEYDAPQVYRTLSGDFYTWMGDVKYNLVETGEVRVAKWSVS